MIEERYSHPINGTNQTENMKLNQATRTMADIYPEQAGCAAAAPGDVFGVGRSEGPSVTRQEGQVVLDRISCRLDDRGQESAALRELRDRILNDRAVARAFDLATALSVI